MGDPSSGCSGWHRLIALAVMFLVMYLVFAATFAAPTWDNSSWRGPAVAATTIGTGAIYLLALVAAVHSVRLARISPHGIVPAAAYSLAGSNVHAVEADGGGRRFRCARHALIWLDWTGRWWWLQRVLALGTMLAILIPDPRATLLMCVGVTMVAIPVVRVIVLPAALAWNRHR